VDVDTKKVVVGTTEANVGVPSLGVENSTIRVPTVAVKGGETAQPQPQQLPPQPQPQPQAQPQPKQ
jgi:hypothetical protein